MYNICINIRRVFSEDAIVSKISINIVQTFEQGINHPQN